MLFVDIFLDLTSDMSSSSVDVLRRTISALKEERLQLLRDDVVCVCVCVHVYFKFCCARTHTGVSHFRVTKFT